MPPTWVKNMADGTVMKYGMVDIPTAEGVSPDHVYVLYIREHDGEMQSACITRLDKPARRP